jgi:hypothetical protein
MPQALKGVLSGGVRLLVNSTEPASGIASISIPRSAANKVHIRGKSRAIVIGRGTVASLDAGANSLNLRVARSMIGKLKHLKHVTITVRLTLFSATRQQVAIDAAGHY